MNEVKNELELQELLRDLKNTVESLLISQVTNVWNVYGGLNRLHQSMENIFRHQFKVMRSDDSKEQDCMVFIQGLDWLQPNSSSVSTDTIYQSHIPIHLKSDKSSIWIYRSLETHSLSQKLSWLISDKEHLLSCYEPSAFLCNEKYCEAALLCLKAIEQYQPALLSEINPILLIDLHQTNRSHRRSSSFPTVPSCRLNLMKKSIDEDKQIVNESFKINENLQQIDYVRSEKKRKQIISKYVGKLKPWQSLPDLKIGIPSKFIRLRERSATVSQYFSMPNTPVHQAVNIIRTPEKKLSPSVLQVDYTNIQKDISHPMESKEANEIYVENKHKHLSDSLKSNDACTVKPMSVKHLNKSKKKISGNDSEYSFMSIPVLAGEKDLNRYPKKSFIEDGGSSIKPMATGYFPRPIQGQSLTSFLSSGQFSSVTSAELDRENAHFSISEAMIAAIEQVKFNKRMKIKCDDEADDSDEEITNLRQRIRIRRKQKLAEKNSKLLRDSFSDSATITPFSSSPNSFSESRSTDDVDDLDVDSASNLVDSRSFSASLASLYSDSDVFKKPREAPDGQSDCMLSAEGVALLLISKFKPNKLPKASDLEWLVSESEVPQQLLPLPTSWPISPDGSSLNSSPKNITPLRGTADWAPPRPQIIFTLHKFETRKMLMEKQQYRCAGCGMRVAIQYASKFRYCDYLGRYFCTGCHNNQLAIIPGRILTKWDFRRYPVSNFSYRLLDQMSPDPLFNINDINSNLYKKVKPLERCHSLRLQLCYLKDFIVTCRFAQKVQNCLQKQPNHLQNEPEVYSINDLYAVKEGDLILRLKEIVEISLIHVGICDLCKARGFVCEICKNNEIIFPWQLRKVTRCVNCGACFHQKCWPNNSPDNNIPCKRCLRLRERRESKQQNIEASSEN